MCYSVRVKEVDKEKIAEVAKSHNLKLLVLFGSQVSGSTHGESDVDVAYLADKNLSFDEEVKLNSDLIPTFRNDKISLVNLKEAPPLLLKQVVSNALVLYENVPHIFEELFLRALRTYEEARPIFELREFYLRNIINKYKHAG